MSFSPEWLALREAADHRSRNPELARALAAHLASKPDVNIIDFGCGTGSNIRATAPLLGPKQRWTLVDYDPKLLKRARTAIQFWADSFDMRGDVLVVKKGARTLEVRFVEADLTKRLEDLLNPANKLDLVTASALFDLASTAFLERLAKAVASTRAAFYTVLTYNGEQGFTPTHAKDAGMIDAFNRHQKTDKGFGASAGPDAPAALKAAFTRAGYRVSEGDSPWVLAAEDAALIAELVPGFAGAVREIGGLTPFEINGWLGTKHARVVVGHTDTLAVPG